ncbi:hypothetical protein XACG102_10930008 [Xanthomonas citri pv. citri]|nr:hypothetical protein XACG102_10930008 [Xanthomonas citri pv. citri]
MAHLLKTMLYIFKLLKQFCTATRKLIYRS